MSSEPGLEGVNLKSARGATRRNIGQASDAQRDFPLVSICLPVYNHASYIRECLDSVVADSYPNKELLIADDGSSDDSFDVISDWFKATSPDLAYRITRHSNAGQSATLNRLLRVARGEYCVFLASDDYLLPGGIEARVAMLRRDPSLVAVFGDAKVVSRGGAVLMESGLRDLYHADKSKYHTRRSLLFQVVVRWSVPGPVLAIRRKNLLEFGGLSEDRKLLEDFDLYIRLADRRQLGFVDVPVAAYRLHGANVSRSGDSGSTIRLAGIRTCLKHLPSVRPLTKLYLVLRMAITAVRLVQWRIFR